MSALKMMLKARTPSFVRLPLPPLLDPQKEVVWYGSDVLYFTGKTSTRKKMLDVRMKVYNRK